MTRPSRSVASAHDPCGQERTGPGRCPPRGALLLLEHPAASEALPPPLMSTCRPLRSAAPGPTNLADGLGTHKDRPLRGAASPPERPPPPPSGAAVAACGRGSPLTPYGHSTSSLPAGEPPSHPAFSFTLLQTACHATRVPPFAWVPPDLQWMVLFLLPYSSSHGPLRPPTSRPRHASGPLTHSSRSRPHAATPVTCPAHVPPMGPPPMLYTTGPAHPRRPTSRRTRPLTWSRSRSTRMRSRPLHGPARTRPHVARTAHAALSPRPMVARSQRHLHTHPR